MNFFKKRWQNLKDGLSVVQVIIDRHQFALTAMLVVVAAVLYVPQLAGLWRKLPRFQDESEQRFSALLFDLFVPTLLLFYLTSWMSILRVHERRMLVMLAVIGVPFGLIAWPALADFARQELVRLLPPDPITGDPYYLNVFVWIIVPVLGSAYFLSWVVILRWQGQDYTGMAMLRNITGLLPWHVFASTKGFVPRWLLIVATTLLFPMTLVNLALIVLNGLLSTYWIYLIETHLVHGRRWAALLLLGLSLSIGFTWLYFHEEYHFFSREGSYPLANLLAGQCLLLPVAVGGWLIVQAMRCLFLGETKLSPTAATTGKIFILWFFTVLLGEFLWVMVKFHPDFSYRIYSIWALFHLVFLVVAACTWVDVCHLEWRLPVRQLTLATIALLAFYQLKPTFLHRDSDDPESPKIKLPSLRVSMETSWYDHLKNRLDHIGNDSKPVVIVAASGGGSRAALFTALVLQGLADEPFPDIADQSWADRILLISSVSGGSLASASFTTLDKNPYRPDYVLKNSFANEQAKNVIASIDQLQQYYSKKVADKLMVACGPNEECANGRKLSPAALEQIQRIRMRPFVDDMCTDYMAPLLRGVMSLKAERGASLQLFWEDQFRWKDLDNLKHDATRPLLVLNATSARQGNRFVLGYPALPRRMFKIAVVDDKTFDAKTPYTQSSSDFLPGYPLSLSQGVRASSNFPWGYQSAYLQRKLHRFRDDQALLNAQQTLYDDFANDANKLLTLMPRELEVFPNGIDYISVEAMHTVLSQLQFLIADPCAPQEARERGLTILKKWETKKWLAGEEQAEVGLLDGGVNDNTGIPTIVEITQHLESAAKTPDPLVDSKSKNTAKSILQNLRSRGVIFVEIDSGAKPGTDKEHELLTPLQGLSNATAAIATDQRTRSIKRLNKLLMNSVKVTPGSGEGKSKEENESTLLHCRFLCNHADESDVMTAWALGPDDKAHVIATYFWEVNTWKKRIVTDRYRLWRQEQGFEKSTTPPPNVPRPTLAQQIEQERQWRAQQQRLMTYQRAKR